LGQAAAAPAPAAPAVVQVHNMREYPGEANLDAEAASGGENPEVHLADASPAWVWANPRPVGYDRDDNLLYGGAMPVEDIWLVWYQGDVQPDIDTPAWTEFLLGNITHGPTAGIFMIIDNVGPTGYLFYEIAAEVATLSNYVGTIIESRMRIIDSTGHEGQGTALCIFDGVYKFIAWIREGGVNIDGEVDVAIDMTQWRQVKFEAQGAEAKLYVDGQLRQTGSYVGATALRKITFGTYADFS